MPNEYWFTAAFADGPEVSYPMSTGRNFDEVLRLLDSLQLTAKHTVATPANWSQGDEVIIPTSVSDEVARAKYPDGFRTLTPYLRMVAQPAAPAGELVENRRELTDIRESMASLLS